MAEPNSKKPNSVNDEGDTSESRNPQGSGLNSNSDALGSSQGIRSTGGSRSPFGDMGRINEHQQPLNQDQQDNNPSLGKQARGAASNYRTLSGLNRPVVPNTGSGGAGSTAGAVGEGAEAGAAGAGALESAGSAVSQASQLGGPELGATAGLAAQIATNPKMRKAAMKGDMGGLAKFAPAMTGFGGLKKGLVGDEDKKSKNNKEISKEGGNPDNESKNDQGHEADADTSGDHGRAHDYAHAVGKSAFQKHTGLGGGFDKYANKAIKGGRNALGLGKDKAKDMLGGAGAEAGKGKGLAKAASSGGFGNLAKDAIIKNEAQKLAKKTHLTNLAMTLTVVVYLILGWLTWINGAGVLFLIPAMFVVTFPWISPKYAYKLALLLVSLFAGPEVYKYGNYVGAGDLKTQTWQKVLIIFSHFLMAALTLLIIAITVGGFCYAALNASYLTQGALYVSSKQAYNFCQSIVGSGPSANAIPAVNTNTTGN